MKIFNSNNSISQICTLEKEETVSDDTTKEWFYKNEDDQTFGPYSLEEST